MNNVTISGEYLAPELMLKGLASSQICPFTSPYREKVCEGFEPSVEECTECMEKELQFSVPQVKDKRFKVIISGTQIDCENFIDNAKTDMVCIFKQTEVSDNCSGNCDECVDQHIIIENEEDTE